MWASRGEMLAPGSTMRGVSAQLPTVDVASAAKAYADFGGLLVGFAFAALFAYLKEMPRRSTTHKPAKKSRGKDRPAVAVTEGHVTLTVLFAMASLTMTSFLYANLAGEAASPASSAAAASSGPPAWAAVALLPYGVAFGLSVLMLFYALTLVMLERRHDAVAGWSYWMVACVGPAVVLRFLLGAAAFSLEDVSGFSSGPGVLLSRGWMFFELALTAVLAAAIMLAGLDWKHTRGLRDWFRDKPAGPPITVFIGVAAMTGLASLYFSGREPSYRPHPYVVILTIVAAAVAIAWFALMCGCVIGPRVDVAVLPRLLERRKRQHSRQAKPAAGTPDSAGQGASG
jgi:hypothetical protein